MPKALLVGDEQPIVVARLVVEPAMPNEEKNRLDRF